MSDDRIDNYYQNDSASLDERAPLPDELALEAGRRLRVVAMAAIGLWALLFAGNHVVTPYLNLPPGQVIPWTRMSDAIALGSIALSAVVYAMTTVAARRGAPLFKIGIIYQVILGLGIGIINQWEPLTVAGRMARLLGGEIKVQSDVGIGSRFRLCLPAVS